MSRVVDGGIKLHTQVVLIPGINDGMNLERTLHDLLQFYPSVMSVSIVPVGLTAHRKGLPQLRSVDAAYAADAIAHVEQIQQKNRKEIGAPFCFLGDEFYIKAGISIPPRSHYGEFPLVENGVGMVRNFLDEFTETMSLDWTSPRGLPIQATVVTGVLFYPILKDCVDRMNTKFRTDLRCLPVENRFLGNGITVAGLLSGSDIYAAVQDQMHGDYLIIPTESMTGERGLFLDDWVQTDLETRLQIPALGGGDHVADFFKLIFSGKRTR
jgi:putative radical SAM enzyme (TIGR03279 family)